MDRLHTRLRLTVFQSKVCPARLHCVFYMLAFTTNGIHQLRIMTNLENKYEYLNGHCRYRDQVPDRAVPKVLRALMLSVGLRVLMTVLLAYQASEEPANDLQRVSQSSPWVSTDHELSCRQF
jgi:hypothetical protein